MAGMLLVHGIGQTGRIPGARAKIVLGWLQEVAYSHHTKVLAPPWQNLDVLTWLFGRIHKSTTKFLSIVVKHT